MYPRFRRLRFDIWLCLAVSTLISFLPVKILKTVLPHAYTAYTEEHVVPDGEIGGTADNRVHRAQNVEDLLAHDTFTIVSPGIEYCNHGAGYHGNRYFYAVTLPSGERIAACINMDAVQNSEESIYSGEATLPVGKIVYEDLSADTYFIGQIEYKEPLSRTDFYIDMLGIGGKISEEDYTTPILTVVQLAVIFMCFPFLHTLGSKFGLFPYFFPPKNKQ